MVLDTETTGLTPSDGHRIVEIGCVEIIDGQLTGNNFHRYINPQRNSISSALKLHMLRREFLRTKPTFAEIFEDFRKYISGANIIIHNARFDLAFLNAEYKRLGHSFEGEISDVCDTLVQARKLYPGKSNTLNALCIRFNIPTRTIHGALLDAILLSKVYLAMIHNNITPKTFTNYVDEL